MHYKKPTAEQIEIMKEYHLRKGAKYGVSKATADRMKLFHNDPKLRNYVRNGKLIPDELLKQYGITRNEAAQSIFRLAQAYNGKNFANVDVGIPKNKSAGKKLFDQIDRAPFGNPYKMVAYKEALNVITDGIGDKYFETTNFENMKREARRILQKEKIPVFDPTIKGSKGINVNELTGITASSRNKSFPYSQFINLMEGNLNTKAYAGFNKQFEKYEKDLQNEIAKGNKGNPNKIIKEYKNYTKDFLGGLKDIDKAQIEKLGLPELSLKEPTELYGKKRTAELLSQGLDLPASYKELKYSIKVPKGTATLKEFISDKNIRDKIISELNPTEKKVISNFGNKITSGLDPTDVLKMLPEKEYQIMKGAMSKVGNLTKMGVRGAQELLVGTGPVGLGITAALTVPFMVADLAEGKRFSEALQNQASALTFGLVPEADKRIIEEIGGPEAGVGFEIQQNIDKLKSLQNDLREAEKRTSDDIMDPEAELAQSNFVENTRKSINKTFEDLLPYLNEQGQIIAPEYNAYLQASNKAEQERAYRKGIGDLQAYNVGFDDISISEEGPFQKEIDKLSREKEQLEKSYSKKQEQPLGFLGGVNTSKVLSADDLINEYAYGGRVGLAAGTIPRAVNWVAKRIQEINKLIKTKRAKAEDFLEEIEILNKAEELNLTKEQVGQILRQQKQASTEKYLKRPIEGDPDLESRLPYDPNATPGNIKKRKNVYGKYKFTGNESLEDLYELERLGKITRMDMNVYDPRYVEWLDAQIINKEKLYTPKEWENTPEVLKNKMRGRIDPDWETANFGEDFDWDRARSTEIQQTQKLKDFDITGRSKNAYGGRINFEKGSDPKDKPILPINPMIGGEDPRGSLQDPGRRDVLKGMGLLGAGVAAGKLGLLKLGKAIKKAPLTNIVKPMGKTMTQFPTWFPTLVNRIRKEGKQIPIFKTKEVNISKQEYDALKQQGTKNLFDRYIGRTENYVNELKQQNIPRYYQKVNTDEIIG